MTNFALNVSEMVALDDGSIAAVSGGAVLLARASGAVTARVELGVTPTWIAPLPGGRVAALKAGAPTELWVIDAAGHGEVRAQLPIDSSPPLVDETGAMLVVTRDGYVIALDNDGGARWNLSLNERLSPPALPLPGGGFAVATTQRSVIFVR